MLFVIFGGTSGPIQQSMSDTLVRIGGNIRSSELHKPEVN